MDLIPQEQVWRALDDALAIVSEFEGAPLRDKLGAIGLDPDDVGEVVMERWEQYQHRGGTDAAAFAFGFAEGLVTGAMLRAH